METLTYLSVILICLLVSAFFSGSEVALLRLRTHHLDSDIESHHGPGAVAARDLLRSTSRLLVTILLGNNVVNILARPSRRRWRSSCSACKRVSWWRRG